MAGSQSNGDGDAGQERAADHELEEINGADTLALEGKDAASTAKGEEERPGDAEVHKTRMNKLQFLLQRSQIYSRIMADKMRKEKEARQQKERRGAVKEEDLKTAQTDRTTRSGPANEKHDGTRVRTEKGWPQKGKRRNEEQKYLVSDYLDTEQVHSGAQAAATKDDGRKAATGQHADLVTTSFKQPSLITGATLREYQLYGVEWLIGLYENGLNGILADEMGLGKTLQTIAFLAHLKSKGQYGPFLVVCPASTLQNWMDEIARFAPKMTALLYYTTDKKQRKRWIDEHRREPKSDAEKLAFPIFVTSYEIAINDARILGSLRWKFIVVDEGHRLKNRNARLTRELKSYYSANRLILTGTPVHNNLAELWSLLNFILPDVFDDQEEFERWFDFSDLQAEGGSARILSREQSQNVISTLRDILDPFILQREKKHVEKDLPPKKEYMLYAPLTAQQKELYEEVLNNSIRARLMEMMSGMTWKEIKQTGLLTAGEGWDTPLHGGAHSSPSNDPRTKARRSRYGLQDGSGIGSSGPSSGTSTPTKRGHGEVDDDEGKTGAGTARKARRSRRSKVHYDEADETEKQFMDRMETGTSSKRSSRRGSLTPQDNQDSVQVLSMSDVQRQSKEHAVKQAQKQVANMHLQNPIMQLRKVCGHPFLLYWPRDPKTGEYIANEDLIHASGKMMMLNRLLDALWSRGHKVLLFSQFTTMLDILQEWCEDYKGVKAFRIDGTVDVHERSRLMKEFNTAKGPKACKLFLLSTRSGGLGVNLVAADTVIFYDTDWNPQVDRQAQDRAHRIGQTRPVLVFRLVTRDTAEERIVKRAFAKQQLSTLVMSGDQFSKQTTDAASAFASGGRRSRVEEWTALLEELKRESVQFDVADKDSQMISDEHLKLLLDRSPSVFEKRSVGWSGDSLTTEKGTPSKATSRMSNGTTKQGKQKGAAVKATFEVTDVLDAMEKEQDEGTDVDDLSLTIGDD